MISIPGQICRLIINEDGWINFVQSHTPHSYTVVDGPATDWSDGMIKSVCGAEITLDYSSMDHDFINVNGITLKKYEKYFNK